MRDSGAAAWETIRRTLIYNALNEKAAAIIRQAKASGRRGLWFSAATVPLIRNLIFANKPLGVSGRDWLPQGAHDPIQKVSALLLRECSPELNWIELGEQRRHTVLVKSPILPRQHVAEAYASMELVVCELERDPEKPNGERVARTEWGTGVPMKPLPESGFRVLPDGVERQTYVVVTFELGQGAEALERQLESELTLRLFPGKRNGQPCALMDCADGVYTWRSEFRPDQLVYPKLWTDSIDANARARAREAVVTIPARNSPFVMCWIPARSDWQLVLSRFHNAVRAEYRPAVETMCRDYWSSSEVLPGVPGEPPLTLPPYPPYPGIAAKIKRKSVSLKDFWIGLTAFEYRKAGIIFDKSPAGQDALKVFLEAEGTADPDLIRPALGDFNTRLREIDTLYAKIA